MIVEGAGRMKLETLKTAADRFPEQEEADGEDPGREGELILGFHRVVSSRLARLRDVAAQFVDESR